MKARLHKLPNHGGWRNFAIISVLLIGYCYYSVLKKSFSVLQQFIGSEFSYSKTELGTIASCFSVAYGVSKLLAGVLSDIFPPHALFCTGLVLASLANVAFSSASSLTAFCTLWAINGLQQGLGWPCLASYILANFEADSLGRIWSAMMFVSLM